MYPKFICGVNLKLRYSNFFSFVIQTGEEVATCPSCSLIVRVIYDVDEFVERLQEERSKDRTKELEKA